MTLASIIIPAHNASETLAACLEACLAQDCTEREIIVVDDGSMDDTGGIAKQYRVKCVSQPQQGPAAARNHGASLAHGAYLVFTDADCVPRKDWLTRLLAKLDDGVVGVGGTYAIANPESRLARLIQTEIQTRHARFGEKVDFLGSFNVLYVKSAFDRVGGFDESFRQASAEDNDLAYRLAAVGGELRFAPGAIVAHFHPTRLVPYLKTQMKHGYWRVKLHRKHAGRLVTGDHYAGGRDFFAVAAALAGLHFLIFGMAGQALFAGGILLLAAAALSFVLCWCLHLLTCLFRFRVYRLEFLLLFPALALVRDLARGVGLLRGVLPFRESMK